MQALSAISYSRNMHAKLLPSDRSLLLFACWANHYLYAYDSWVGTVTSYHAVYDALKKLSDHNLQRIKDIATDPKSAVSVHLDNIQYYVCSHTYTIGQEAHMVVRTVVMAIKLEGFNPAALDILDKWCCIAENKWQSLTSDSLWALIDHSHLDIICTLQ